MGVQDQNIGDAIGLLAMASAAQGIRVEWNKLPLEGGTDAAYGTVRWRTIFDADKTPGSSGMVVGIAEFAPHGTLPPHRHEAPEAYLGLEGEATVTISGIAHRLTPGVALFVPGNAEHSTLASASGARFLYVFPRDRFSEVHYKFSPIEIEHPLAKAGE